MKQSIKGGIQPCLAEIEIEQEKYRLKINAAANTGCRFDGTLRNVVAEPIYVQKVYDAALFNLQGLRSIIGQPFSPALGEGASIIRILDIRCRKF